MHVLMHQSILQSRWVGVNELQSAKLQAAFQTYAAWHYAVVEDFTFRPYNRANLEATSPENRAEMYNEDTTSCRTWSLYLQYAAFTGSDTLYPPSASATYTPGKNFL